MHFPRSAARLLALVLVTSGGLAACGEDAVTTPAPTPAGPTAPPTPTPCFVAQAVPDSLTQTVKLTSLPGGLQSGDIRPGCGATAKTGDHLSVQYTGWLTTTGVQFDSSRKTGGQPFPFNLGKGEVIPGWDEGIPGLRVGGKRRLVIPGSLAYGARGQPGSPIGPNASLTFDIELLAIG